MDNEVDVYNGFIARNFEQQKLLQLPFDQNYRRKSVIRISRPV